MLLGIVMMLLASAAFYGAPIVLRLVTRTLPDHTGAALLHAVLTRRAGLVGLVLSLLGWSLQVVALMFISLTLGRILFAAGLGLLLVLAHRTLHEPVGRREVLGVLAVIGGLAAVATAPPAHTSASPSSVQWLLVVLLGAVLLAPFVLRPAGRPVDALLSAVAAGTAYVLAALFNKGLADLLRHMQLLPLLLLLAGPMLALYVLTMFIPFARNFFGLALLPVMDVALIAAVVAVWALALRFAWRRRLFERFLGLDTG